MKDITSEDLNAAVLDQMVAGRMRGKRYAFVPTSHDDRWGLGVAVENEDGFNPIKGFSFETRYNAQHYADRLNEHIGLTPREAMDIVTTTMRGTVRGLDTWEH